ncbi:MAG: sigma-70 family RNA polymerase sigma factor [Clostridium sp.]
MDTDLLIEGLKNNDYEVFNEFTEKYSRLILKVISSVLREPHEKDFIMECYNDSLLIVWQKIGTFRGECPLVNWIATVTKYKALDYKRKLKKSYNLVEISEEHLSPGKSAEEEFMEEVAHSNLKQAIEMLSKKDKDIFMKRYILQQSIEEICSDESLSENALYKRISRMKKSLKLILDDINKKEDEKYAS